MLGPVMNARAMEAEPAVSAVVSKTDGQDKRTSAARGIAVAVLLSLPFWMLIAVVAFLVF